MALRALCFWADRQVVLNSNQTQSLPAGLLSKSLCSELKRDFCEQRKWWNACKQLKSWARCVLSGNKACSSLQTWCLLLIFQRTTTWSPSAKLCFRRCGNAAPGTPRADPSVVQGLREKKGREKRLSWLQKEFPHHLSNTMQLQQVLEHGLTWRARVCFFKPSSDFQKSQIAPRTHRLAHQKVKHSTNRWPVNKLYFLYEHIIYVASASHLWNVNLMFLGCLPYSNPSLL